MLNIQENVSLAPLNSFRIGGLASFYVEVSNVEELKEAVQFAKEKDIDFFVLGGGTNLLMSDKGFVGIVIRIKLNETKFDENVLEVGAGVPLIKAVNVAAEKGLLGMESLAGIPGTVGGAVRGNAGAFGCEICTVVDKVTAFDCQKLETVCFGGAECAFDYRTSIFKSKKDLIVVSVSFALEPGRGEEIQKKVKDTITKRVSTGLHGVKSAGSFFMNPFVQSEKILADFEKDNGSPSRNGKVPAGWIIDQAGLRGKKIGGAGISELHANYIVNNGDAKAEDVIILESYIKQQVRDKFGVQLESEVNHVGF
jgi:UDP-N-acetylmuramate dehydrogenase